MKQQGFQPTGVTFVFMLHAYASLGALEKGKQVHAAIVEARLELDVFVGAALINMYVKQGFVEFARQVFDRLPEKTVVSWTTMISGYAQVGNVGDAFALYNQMKGHNVKPNSVTFVCILKACSSNATLHLGKQVHAEIIDAGLESNVFIGTALIDMYAKCGSLVDARQVFERSLQEHVVSWNAIISGYAMHGKGVEAFHLFHRMKQHNVKPNNVTFLSVLCLCSRLGLVDESRRLFDMMSNDYELSPTFKHYGCLVDLFGRAGQLNEAILLIDDSPLTSELSLWMSLLGACRLHGDVKLAEYVAKRVLELDPQNSAACVLLSNLYAEGRSWSKRAELRMLMKERGVRKEPGRSLMA
ncbi:hypothetical protein O6H91_05G086400 [Diphasiastrum complanatum]|nr:hypothetical protein O6H91_05G086400 [Diphasiastrum complanatum]